MRLTRPAVAATLTAATALLFAGAPANAVQQVGPNTTFTDIHIAQDGSVPTPSTDGNDIPNIDSVKSTLIAYYGATKGTDPAHAYSDLAPATTYLPNLTDSAYAKNTEAVADGILKKLPATAPANAAVVFDVDSTLLSDFGNEEDSNFNYSPTLNAVWVNNELMPAVAGMPHLVQTLASEGYAIYGITGRPYSQEDATVGNLTKAGYTAADGTPLFDNDNLYTKWNTGDPAAKPAYIGDCTLSATCNTVEYKANTRKHIEQDLGKTIVMNVGDQWSDLEGGYAADYTKIPNPSYFLPAADIASAPASDSSMVLPSTYTMKPDGSTGATATDGDALPNEGAIVDEIRAYYGASGGTANPTSSPYITQMTGLEAGWTKTLSSDCRTGAQKVAAAKAQLAQDKRNVTKASKALAKAKRHHRGVAAARRQLAAATRAASGVSVPAAPAAVFDADDTTLWNYNYEDGGSGFVYNPTTNAEWVHAEKFPAVPGMVSLVRKVKAAGCTIFGITGRPGAGQTDDQTPDTLANLVKDGYTANGKPLFAASRFFTKPATMPSYVDCGDDQSCTTIEYKSSTRAHIEDLGYNVVANLGDQFSDLHGGYADATYKIPNPTYYLP